MKIMSLVAVETGELLDTLVIHDDGVVTYSSGAAKPVVSTLIQAFRERGLTSPHPLPVVAEAWEEWTNGRVRLTSNHTSYWVPPVPEIPMELDEARRDRHLRRYWTRGPGAAKIRWGTGGDFMRCVRQLRKYVRDPKGLCAVYHRIAIGKWPGRGRGH